MTPIAIFWFRRDLRLNDNAGLYHALKSGLRVLPIFIFDKNILDKLADKKDARVSFLHDTVLHLQSQLSDIGSQLQVFYDTPEQVFSSLMNDYKMAAVYTNHDYEPYAISRDEVIQKKIEDKGISWHTFKDQVIFERLEVAKDDGLPYTVFTPYSRKWRAKLADKTQQVIQPDGTQKSVSFYLKPYLTERYFSGFWQTDSKPILALEDMGFTKSDIVFPAPKVFVGLIKNYAELRDYPAQPATSKLGIHFRFGTVSIREKARNAAAISDVFLNELIWRDFYSQILANFPRVATAAFKPEYDNIVWRNAPQDFEAWCNGQTGYPIVDAGMRELNTTGFMHNRVRMITASFLTKHLLVDWRWGEAYFAQKLLDFDLASNNGGWQWAAGCGTDAAPYFRIFSPDAQTEKFDKQREYIRKWVPEYLSTEYAKSIVDHKFARERCLETYKAALSK